VQKGSRKSNELGREIDGELGKGTNKRLVRAGEAGGERGSRGVGREGGGERKELVEEQGGKE